MEEYEVSIREMMEKREHDNLQKLASFSDEAVRDYEEEPCPVRTAYQRDRDRILHCKSFRRMKDKTQAFVAATGDHYRNRLTHTLEVAQEARTIAKALALNEELTEAISLGHDLGHTPFGHVGESALDKALREVDPSLGFLHQEHSIRIVEVLEKEGRGLNLTWAVRDGILNHGTTGHPATLEGQIVRICDKIAYINHDIDDAVRAGLLRESDLPAEYTEILGHSFGERVNSLISDAICSSMDKDRICQSQEAEQAMRGLRTFLFEHVYHNPVVDREQVKAEQIVRDLFYYYMEHTDLLRDETGEYLDHSIPRELVVRDYIAGMTDHYAIRKFEEFFIPGGWRRQHVLF